MISARICTPMFDFGHLQFALPFFGGTKLADGIDGCFLVWESIPVLHGVIVLRHLLHLLDEFTLVPAFQFPAVLSVQFVTHEERVAIDNTTTAYILTATETITHAA